MVRELGFHTFSDRGGGGKQTLRLVQWSVNDLNTSQTCGTDDVCLSVSPFNYLGLSRFAGRPPCVCRRQVGNHTAGRSLALEGKATYHWWGLAAVYAACSTRLFLLPIEAQGLALGRFIYNLRCSKGAYN